MNFRKHLYVFFFLLIGSVRSVCAGEVLTWQEAVALAHRYNPTLLHAAATVRQAEQALSRTYSNHLPQVAITGSATQSDSDTSGFSRDYGYGVSGSLSLFNGFSDTTNTLLRRDELQLARIAFERARSDTLCAVRECFIDLLWAQETTALSEEILKRRSENYAMIQLKYHAGSEDRGSLLRVEADKVQADYDLAKARRAQGTAQAAFLQAIGRDDDTDVAVRGSFDMVRPATETPPRDAVTKTPEYRAADSTLTKAAHAITAATSGLYPSLSVSAGTSKFGPSWAPENNRWNLGLNLSYPLFPGGRNLYDVRIAITEKAIAEQSLRETRQRLAATLVTTYNALIDAADAVTVKTRYLAAAELQSSIITTKYLNGLASYQDWYTIENDYIAARRTLLSSQHEAAVAETRWKNFLGEGY